MRPFRFKSAISSYRAANLSKRNKSFWEIDSRSGCRRFSGSFYATASGGIGWGVPAAVGVALGDRASGVKRTVVATIGDGSFQYSVQAIWTAAQHDLPIVFVVMRNEEYSILKSFALLEKTPGVPGMDLPGLDIVSIATGFGCRAVHADTTEQVTEQFTAALTAHGPTVIVVQTQPMAAHLG
jgi:benzoylformate decarboxylase